MTRILVVDDDAFFGQMLLDWLLEQGYVGERVTTAELALDAAVADERPEIFLVDERLGPGLSGVELIAQLQEVAPESDAILFTGSADPEIARRAYLAGTWRYVRRPFDPNEMGYVLAALLQWRSARAAQYERDWLVILNRIVERLQYAHTVEQLGQVLVDGSVELGFDRARFYRVRTVDGAPTLLGLCQSGVNQVVNFEQVEYAVKKTLYHQKAFAERKPTFFRNRELGPSFLSTLPQTEGFPESLGEWVILPLFSGDECIGSLSMDNCRTDKSIHPQQKELLRLFAGQAVSALERALQWEQARQEKEAENLARRIIRQMGNPATEGALERLLLAIHENFLGKDRDDNFIIVLHDKESGWYRYRLHIESGERVAPSWCPPTQGGLIEYVMTQNSPLFLPSETAAFRKDNGIAQVGSHPACAWMGAPLRIGDEVIGAMVVENDCRDFAFSEDQYKRLVFLAERLVSVIQAAWLNEQQRKINELLATLETGSVRVTQLAMQSEDWLWHTTLTLCTAHYGAGFDRAMLFLVERNRATGGRRLWGRMAIGHLGEESARKDWEKDVAEGMGWEKYLTELEDRSLADTPLHEAVQGFLIEPEKTSPIFQQMFEKPSVLKVLQKEAATQLPPDFLKKFGITDYLLIPVQAGSRLLGVVILDNIWKTDPHQYSALPYIDALTNQAALTYEILQSRREQEELVAIQRDVLAHASIDLGQTLNKIRSAVLDALDADIVSIDVLGDVPELHYTDDFSGYVDGENLPYLHQPSHQPGSLARHILKNGLVVIENLPEHGTLYDGERADAHIFIQEKNIQAMIGVLIRGPRQGTPRGLLFVHYHTPREFRPNELELVRVYAQLAGVAIRNWRDTQEIREEKEGREAELGRVGHVLAGALQVAQTVDPSQAEYAIINLLLSEVPTLFGAAEVTASITLKRWERSGPAQEPVEVHEYLYSLASNIPTKRLYANEDKSINSRAIRQKITQNVPDVHKDPDYRLRTPDSQTLSELDIPIKLDGEVIGALNLESLHPATFTPHHEAMGKRFADIGTLALGTVRRQQNLRTVLQSVKAITTPTQLPETLQEIADGIKLAVPNLPILTIWYKDPQKDKLTLANSFFGIRDVKALHQDQPRPDGMVYHALELHEPRWIDDVSTDGIFASKPFVAAEGICSTAVFPLRAQEEAVGVMFFSYREQHRFTDEEKRLYPILAAVAAASIQDAWLLEKARRERKQAQKEEKRFRMALDVTEAVGSELEQEKVIHRILTRISQDNLFPDTTAAILRYDRDVRRLIFTEASLPFYFSEPTGKFPLDSISVDGRSLAAAVARRSLESGNKEILNEPDVLNNPDYLPARKDTRSELAITLWRQDKKRSSQDEKLIGVLVLESTRQNAFDEDAVELAALLAKVARMAMERAIERDDLEVSTVVAGATAWATEIAHDIEEEIYNIRSGVAAVRELAPVDALRYLTLIDASAARLVAATPPESQPPEEVVIDDYLRSLVQRLLQEMDGSIATDFHFCCPELTLESYPPALERIFRHLLRNACQWMHKGERPKIVRVETELLPQFNQLEIRLADTGPGIPAQQQPMLFRRRASRNQNGHGGLGLVLVGFLIKTIGGSIHSLDSQPGWGATFGIRLPLTLPEGRLVVQPQEFANE